ncbi:MAG: hypothetical protein ACFFDN_35380 [Candidatus Hodarchaeota archaeon]
MIKIGKKALIGILIIACVISGAGIGYLVMANSQQDSIVPILITIQLYGAMSISISGIPDRFLSDPGDEIWYLDVKPYIDSPIIPISHLSLFTNHTNYSDLTITVFNHIKTLKFEFIDSGVRNIRVSVSYFGIVASDTFQVEWFAMI